MGEFVTPTGLKRKTLQEIRTEFENGLKRVFGPSFETSVDSPNGLLISQLSLSFSKLWELCQEIYLSRDPAQAEGEALDWAAALSGLSRKSATACEVIAMLYGDEETVTVPAGSRATRSRGSLAFTLDETVTINRTACKELLIVDDGSEKNTEYVFNFTFGTVTLNNSTTQSNLQRLSTLVTAAGGSAQITQLGLRVYLQEGGNVGITGSMPDDFIIYGGAEGRFTAVSTGDQTCEIGELDTVSSTVENWELVYNYSAGVPGTNMESDEHLRIRRAAAVRSIQARGTDPAIAAHLIEDVEGVTTAVVKSNRLLQTDSDGRPPKSFETLVVGGSDEDVARCIWENQPSGIQSHGNVSVFIRDNNGDEQLIKFSRPQAKYLWLKITYKLYDEEQAPTTDEIKATLVEWANKEYQMGKDVIPTRVLQGLYNVGGIGTASVQVAVTNSESGTPSFGISVIPIGPAEYASLIASRITLIEES